MLKVTGNSKNKNEGIMHIRETPMSWLIRVIKGA